MAVWVPFRSIALECARIGSGPLFLLSLSIASSSLPFPVGTDRRTGFPIGALRALRLSGYVSYSARPSAET